MRQTDFAPGMHLLLDLEGARDLADAPRLEAVLRGAAVAAGARVIGAQFRSFGAGQGGTGVVLLAESHISIRTWPETGLAAVDIFMCGGSAPERARAHIEAALAPERARCTAIRRGA